MNHYLLQKLYLDREHLQGTEIPSYYSLVPPPLLLIPNHCPPLSSMNDEDDSTNVLCDVRLRRKKQRWEERGEHHSSFSLELRITLGKMITTPSYPCPSPHNGDDISLVILPEDSTSIHILPILFIHRLRSTLYRSHINSIHLYLLFIVFRCRE